MYTFSNRYAAHNMSRTAIVTVPDQVAKDQRAFDGKSFPIIKADGTKGRAKLMGEEYGLNTAGTGDMVVRIAA